MSRRGSAKRIRRATLVPMERIERAIYLVRGEKVMLDEDLARLYGVQTRSLNRAVKRNIDRFPEAFMFRLTKAEWRNLMCQIGTSSAWGGRRKVPSVFTIGFKTNKERGIHGKSR